MKTRIPAVPVISTLSFLLLATMVVLWIRSRHHADAVGFYTPSGHLEAISSDKGGMLFFFSDIPFGREMGLSADAMSTSAQEFTPIHDLLFDVTSLKTKLIGFQLASGTVGQWGWKFSAVIVPYWALLILLAILPLTQFRGSVVRARRKKRGECLICGYDLRHSQDRCPECGTPIGGKGDAVRKDQAMGSSLPIAGVLWLILIVGIIAVGGEMLVRGRHAAAAAAIAPRQRAISNQPLKQIESYGKLRSDTQHWFEPQAIRVCWAGAAPRVVRAYPVNDLLTTANVDDTNVGLSTGPLVFSGDLAWPSSRFVVTSDALGQLIATMILPDDWIENGGSIGGYSVAAGRLWVWQTQQGHAAVRTLLAALRSPVDCAIEPSTTRASDDAQAHLDQVIPELKLDSTTLEAAIETLRQATHSNIVVYWPDLEAIGIHRDMPIQMHLWNVTLDRALGAILSLAGGEYPGMRAVEDGIIVVGSPEKLRSNPATIKVYNVRDLIARYCANHRASVATTQSNQAATQPDPAEAASAEEAAQAIADIVERFVGTDSWKDNGGSIGNLREFNGLLVISQSRSAHREIEQLLHKLRAGETPLDAPARKK